MSPPFRVIPPTGRNEGAAGLPVDAPGSPPGETRISLRDLTKVFRLREGDFVAVDGFSLDIRDGEFLSIVGPSGCGKSTVLRILAGLERHTSGRVEIEVSDSGAPQLNMVFQEASALPWMTVADNVAYGLRRRRMPAGEVEEKVSYWLNAMALTRFRNAYPHQLSGGMKQRVSIARAFANDPDILLMDEPFAALDALTKILLQNELLALWETTRKTVVYVTHSLEEALTLSDRVVVMAARPGTVKSVLDIPFERPRDSVALKADPRYSALYAQIWSQLQEEVMKPQVRDAH
ncbi:ABC transporter ATP-binding protein [Bradyrhizobium sp. U87765 SZCCT0131]|uniref:ABC transporter ATP-binding protein n=1 Tax=unclassified Bradyrhizobium TaxID=2631580 RepID=UPI001BA8B768|nr:MULTISPECIES: ABC transporter ATP-binding protein [unclassified Bradyrhizobium]MBR1219632.1 ABC transporter ATP-binding protein [Bradyrhizobium sp. U87765 SZCCT0131]MBR1262283.1 ABC transporter ATP-binding protein [Bradyrhizobium sp. U87765 SZCCT0134]MBR1308534.1 ABC transporter ATP-binding protein [Bradyrhizobium sp. U87765 SZCCT0110]MBR1318065.1 ABC transporter ATP-binding protein [Bradyrhizobium sp. U87765 SZCCT0109]MBR1351768.1 ABC transporter ATP-binding protein [Bradyrhizobium sp. U87